jgi:hypothetical protein
MPDDDFRETQETSVHWYRCKNPTCRRWFNIRLFSSGNPGEEQDPYAQGYASQMNLHQMFCPMCGHKHGA